MRILNIKYAKSNQLFNEPAEIVISVIEQNHFYNFCFVDVNVFGSALRVGSLELCLCNRMAKLVFTD